MFVRYKNDGNKELFFALKNKTVSYNPPDNTMTRVSYVDESTDEILQITPDGGPAIQEGFDMSPIFKTEEKMIVKTIVRQPDWSFNIIIQ